MIAPSAPAPPSPAATVVLLRERRGPAGPGVEAFLVRRPRTASFMPGAHVFPGGRLDPADGDARLVAQSDGAPALLAGVRSADAVPRALAAIRELFEEASVLIVRGTDGQPLGRSASTPAVARLDAMRTQVHAGRVSFAALCAREGWRPALDLLVPLGYWITPAVEPRRFDTRFFLARLPEGQEARVDGVEAEAGEWMDPAGAVARYAAGELMLAPPTLRTLQELARCATFEAAVAMAARLPQGAVTPRLHESGGRRWLLLPGDPLYPAADGACVPPPTRLEHVGGRWVFVDVEPTGA